MSRENLNQQTWYRAIKVLFILAFIFVQGIGVLISYEIANDGDPVIHCDNGKTFPSPTSYLDSSEKLEIYKKCDLTSFLLTKSDVPGTLTKDQIDDVRERVTEMQNNNELQSDIQTAVNEFKQIYSNSERGNGEPVSLTKKEFEERYGHDPDDTFTTIGSGTFIANFTLEKEAKYGLGAQIAIYASIFLGILFLFWLFSRIFFYVIVKEKFLKLH
jgi:hypothetical protein